MWGGANTIRIHSPEKVTVECRQAEISAVETLTVTAPEGSTFNGDVRINGSISWSGEALGDGPAPATGFTTALVNWSAAACILLVLS